MNIANKTEMTCKNFTNEIKSVTIKARVKETVKLLWNAKFFLQGFKLDCQYASPIVVKVVDVIDLKYKRFFIRAKTKFHAE